MLTGERGGSGKNLEKWVEYDQKTLNSQKWISPFKVFFSVYNETKLEINSKRNKEGIQILIS